MGKTIIYQMLPRLWGNLVKDPVPSGSLERNGSGGFSSIDEATLSWLKGTLGVTHVWYTGVIRHATTACFEGCPASDTSVVKGLAGSPYAITDYYDVNPYLADNPKDRLSEFNQLLKRTHAAGLKALIDFVPNHVSRDYGKVGLVHDSPFGTLGKSDDVSVHWSPENDFYYYPGQSLTLPGGGRYYENPAKASGNRFSPSPEINDWYETIRINYCDFHTTTWDRMLDIVLYWCAKGVDGFRCDMVEMVPWQFMRWLISEVKRRYPTVIFVAEVYQKDLYRLYTGEVGFDLLYDKSGLYDTLRSIVEGYGTARGITWNWQSLGDLQPKMLNFLENHDEMRFASDYFGKEPMRAASSLCAGLLLNDSAYMIYNGQEIGERGMDAEGFSGRDGRTTIFDWWSVASLRRLFGHIHGKDCLTEQEKETLRLYKETLALASPFSGGKTYDLCYCNEGSSGFDPDRHFVFLRDGVAGACLIVCDFSGKDSLVDVKIPVEAFEYLGINKTEALEVSVSVKGFGYSVLPV